MTNDKDCVLEERFDNVLVLTMNRPERHHALNQALAQRLAAALTRAQEDPEVRVIILTGSGTKAFCAGADMIEISGIEDGESDTTPSKVILAIDKVAHTPLPVIAAINGYCYGAGALLAIACDIRLACESATFRLPGAEYGLVVGAATFPRLVGSSRAQELIFTAR